MSTKYTCIKCGLATTARQRPENCFKGGYHEWVVEEEIPQDRQQDKPGTVISSESLPPVSRGEKPERATRTQAA